MSLASPGLPYLLAVTLLPVCAGIAVGALGRQLSRCNRFGGMLVSLFASMVAIGAIASVDWVGFWDLVFAAVGFEAGYLAVVLAPSVRAGCANLLLAVSALGFACLAIEAVMGGGLGMSPRPPEPVTGIGSLRVSSFEPACEAIYETDRFLAGLVPDPATAVEPGVLHLGDSMVFGTGAGGPQAAFPSLLSRLDAGRTHFNLGLWGSSTDGQWLALRSVLKRMQPVWVVHYVFLGNDLQEIDRPSLCCDQKGLVVYSEGLTPRCDRAQYEIPLRERLESSPAPYLIRGLAHRSAFAAQLVVGFKRLGAVIAGSGVMGERFGVLPPLDERQFDRFRRLELALRVTAESAGARFIVVVLPSRQTVAQAVGRNAIALDLWQGDGMKGRNRVLEILEQANFELIDAFELVRSLVTDVDEARWFARDLPGDFHFSVEGHERMARWLWPRLESRLAR